MKVKVIAIGNKLMMDDGVGVRVVEKIKDELKKSGVEVIIGETDYEYCLSKIDNDDFIIIVDSTYLEKIPGTITSVPLERIKDYSQSFYSQHEASLIQMLNIYKKKIKGWFIGIEIGRVDFSLNLSDSLQNLFNGICNDVKKIINEIMEDVKDA